MLDIIKIQDIHTLQQFKFIYKLLHDKLPHYFKSMTVTHNRDIHQYNTRQRNNILVPTIQHEFARKCICNQISKIIVDQINTHSLKGFATYIKNYLINVVKNPIDGASPDLYIIELTSIYIVIQKILNKSGRATGNS